MTQQPSVVRMVHYVSRGSADGAFLPVCRAAVITEVHDMDPVPEHGVPYVSLCVMNPTGLFFDQHVRYDEANQGGTWHWPERV